MKYLKTYESLNDEDLQIIKDILLEVEDMGFETKVGKAAYYWRITIGKSIREQSVLVQDQLSFIEFEDIKDCVLRLQDYAGDRFSEFMYGIYKRYSTFGGSGDGSFLDWTSIKLNEDKDYLNSIMPNRINMVCLWIKYKTEI